MAILGDAYQYYRLFATSGTSSGYLSFNEFELYESLDASTPNLCIGATATASSTNGAKAPARAIDGVPSTEWESNSTYPHWFAVKLVEPKPVRLIKLISTTYTNEAPKDFTIQGSHDGSVWVDLYPETGNTQNLITRRIDLSVSGVSKLDTGQATLRVLIYDWATGNKIATITPSEDGSWFYALKTNADVMVAHLGPVGFEPKIDGPITPYAW